MSCFLDLETGLPSTECPEWSECTDLDPKEIPRAWYEVLTEFNFLLDGLPSEEGIVCYVSRVHLYERRRQNAGQSTLMTQHEKRGISIPFPHFQVSDLRPSSA